MIREEHKPLKISANTVNQDCNEENAVKVWNGGCKTDNRSPEEAHDPVCDIILQCK
jgi:hypothetical protein